MALRHSRICNISPVQLASNLAENSRKVRLVDCRSFLEYNDNHIVGAVNICCSKLIKRRLQQEKISLKDLLGYCRIEVDESCDIIIYDQRSQSADEVSLDSFVYVLLKKLILVFEKVYLLSGGFVGFQHIYPEFTENKTWKYPGLTALSQPCLPTTSCGPTRILPFLYLGSEEDANNKELLQSHNITYELNVSNKCPKPDFVSDGHFLRIPVNDSHNEKLIPYFIQAFQFVDKARESNESVLVHCLAGISRSPTVAIAYVMRHLQMTCEDAYRYVKSKRATISPNFNFLGQLLEYEKQLVQDKIIEKSVQGPSFSSMSHSADFALGPPLAMTMSPPTSFSKPIIGKRLNLSLRFPPGMDSPSLSSPKDSSPTSAMARLQFDKPLGKENRTGCTSPSTSSLSLGLVSLSRPTRLVKEQNVTAIQEEEVGGWESVSKSSVTHHSVSISISKGFKCRKSSTDLQQQYSCAEQSPKLYSTAQPHSSRDRGLQGQEHAKKFRVHKILVEGSDAKDVSSIPSDQSSEDQLKSAEPVPSCSSSASIPEESISASTSGVSLSLMSNSYKREFSRSDSVSTSGIGSEISENELQASGSWEMSESGTTADDGVFSDFCGYSKSPKNSRQLQLWSSDSGHWSSLSADDGMSCSSASIMEVPTNLHSNEGESKSPEKRKFPGSAGPHFPNSSMNLSSLEKRKSYAAGESSTGEEWGTGDVSRPKRWSISEDISKSDSSTSCTEDESVALEEEQLEIRCIEQEMQHRLSVSENIDIGGRSSGIVGSSGTHLNFDNHWFNLLSGRELTCCERQGEGLLYRVHSCPGFLGYRDWLQMRKNVPDSHLDEPISDSVLLKMRSCCHRSRHERSFEHSAVHHPWNKNRLSCGHVDYDDLLCKLCKLHNVHDTKPESSHSSSSTLASSSFSIVVQ